MPLPGFGSLWPFHASRPYDEFAGGEQIGFWVERGTLYVNLLDFVMYVSGRRGHIPTSELEAESRKEISQLPAVPLVLPPILDRLNGLPRYGHQGYCTSMTAVVAFGSFRHVSCPGSREYFLKHGSTLDEWRQAVREAYVKVLDRWWEAIQESRDVPLKLGRAVGSIVVNESNEIWIRDVTGELMMRGARGPSLRVTLQHGTDVCC